MKEKIILKSTFPEQYGDLEVECKVIENDKIGEYLESISSEKKFVAYKTGAVLARKGQVGEKVKTVLKTIVDDKQYILREEEGTVKERTYIRKTTVAGDIKEYPVTSTDYVITNISSTSNEEYITKAEQVEKTYELIQKTRRGDLLLPKCDPRVLTQVDEDIIIITAWGSKAVCLKGGYIVTYNAAENDYNVLEKGAFESTYTIETSKVKTLKRN